MGVSTVDVTAAQAGALYKAPGATPHAPASDWLRELRHVPDSVLHRRRRQAAHLQLRNLKPRSILFLCHGNICRSPFAAAVFERSCSPLTASTVSVRSAGFIGPGRIAPAKALAAALRRGVDLSGHRSMIATRAALQAADLILVMSSEQARSLRTFVRSGTTRVLMLGDLDPAPITRRTITDPWGGSDDAFEASYARIERCVGELVRIIEGAQ